MSIKEIKSGTLYKEYALEIPYEEINKIIDSKINELLPTVSLPGFRRGKAPLNIVRKKYENNVLSESLDKLVQDKMKLLLDEKKLKPFTQPKIDLKKYEKNEPIEVEIKIDLEPEIKLAEFKKMKVNEYEIDLDKNLIEDNYNEFLKSQKKYLEIKNIRQIKKTDKVLIDLSSNDESVPDFLKVQKNLSIVIDSDYQILPSIGDKLVENKLKKGDEVIIPVLCWSTSLWPLVQFGLKPVFIDIDPNTLNVNEDDLIKKINSRTKCIFLVNVHGNSCDLFKIRKIAKKKKIILIEDNCESLGSKLKNKHLGTFGDFGTFSFFYSAKNTID